jgi:hypothetical protein
MRLSIWLVVLGGGMIAAIGRERRLGQLLGDDALAARDDVVGHAVGDQHAEVDAIGDGVPSDLLELTRLGVEQVPVPVVFGEAAADVLVGHGPMERVSQA